MTLSPTATSLPGIVEAVDDEVGGLDVRERVLRHETLPLLVCRMAGGAVGVDRAGNVLVMRDCLVARPVQNL